MKQIRQMENYSNNNVNYSNNSYITISAYGNANANDKVKDNGNDKNDMIMIS